VSRGLAGSRSAALEPSGPAAVPVRRLKKADFVRACLDAPQALIYFLLNVGDGDTQLMLLPTDAGTAGEGSRRAIVVDIATTKKLPALIEALAEKDILVEREDLFPVVVASHPHDDHIGGMAEFLRTYGHLVREYWESGYYHPTATYVELMVALEANPQIQRTLPTSGMTRFIDKIKIMSLSPGIGLRTRFDSYGVNVNDASITLKIEFPAARIVQVGENRDYVPLRDPWSLVLGADAQTTSWAQATVDFPQLHVGERSQLSEELRKSVGRDWLKAHIFKVPHHASKHGLNLELVERMSPTLCLISSTGGGRRHGFPHHLALASIREAIQPTATSGEPYKADHDLGIHYTSAMDTEGKTLGSIAVMVSPGKRSPLRVWRFGDEDGPKIELDDAREYRLRA
jgi:beta-lactamase superfamily II metal-dependent hydrolase